jgi:hypothetical protein
MGQNHTGRSTPQTDYSTAAGQRKYRVRTGSGRTGGMMLVGVKQAQRNLINGPKVAGVGKATASFRHVTCLCITWEVDRRTWVV